MYTRIMITWWTQGIFHESGYIVTLELTRENVFCRIVEEDQCGIRPHIKLGAQALIRRTIQRAKLDDTANKTCGLKHQVH